MQSLSKLKEKNDTLARELAESCRDFIELRYAFVELREKYTLQSKAFQNFLMNTENIDEKSAGHRIDALIKIEMQNATQLEFEFNK